MGGIAWLLLLFSACALSCKTDMDCSLLGVCSGGVCRCDPGWTSTDCSAADLLPYVKGEGYINESAASWGGRPVFYKGQYHMIATEISQRCPLILFMNNSQIIRAVSDTPGGPYHKVETVLPPFHHNPTVIGPTPDGYYLMYYIGSKNPGASHIDCTSAVPKECTARNRWCRGTHNPYSNGAITMAYSTSMEGPWVEREILPYNAAGHERWDYINNNPSATILANGTIFMVFRGGGGPSGPSGEFLGIATAPHWSSNYTRRPDPIMTPTSGTGNHEDPFVFVNARGHFHAITHNQGGGRVCKNSEHSCGAHLFSEDGWKWSVSPTPVYGAVVKLADGSVKSLLTRQRPQLIFNGSRPMYLFNGASFDGNNNDVNMLTHTMAFRFA